MSQESGRSPVISPHKIPTESRPASPQSSTLSDDQAWEVVKKRRLVGQVVFGEAVQIEPWGVFFDIGERFAAFVDPLDLGNEELAIGTRRCLKVLQHAEWNRQIRVAFASQKEWFISIMSPLDRAGAARVEGKLLRFRDEFRSWSDEERAKFREAVWYAARANDLFGLLPGGFRNMLESSEEYYDDEGNVTYSSSSGRFSPRVLFFAVEAWNRGEEFLPTSLCKLYSSKIPDCVTQ